MRCCLFSNPLLHGGFSSTRRAFLWYDFKVNKLLWAASSARYPQMELSAPPLPAEAEGDGWSGSRNGAFSSTCSGTSGDSSVFPSGWCARQQAPCARPAVFARLELAGAAASLPEGSQEHWGAFCPCPALLERRLHLWPFLLGLSSKTWRNRNLQGLVSLLHSSFSWELQKWDSLASPVLALCCSHSARPWNEWASVLFRNVLDRKRCVPGRAGWPAAVILAVKVQVVWLIYDFLPTSPTVRFHLLRVFHECWVGDLWIGTLEI